MLGTKDVLWAIAVSKGEVGSDNLTSETRNPLLALGEFVCMFGCVNVWI